MSNLSEAIELVNKSNVTALDFVGGILGALADASGAFATIGLVVSAFVQKNNDAGILLSQIKDVMKSVLEETNARGRFQDIVNRLGKVDDALAEAQSIVDVLLDDVTVNAPLPNHARSDRIRRCAAAMERLIERENWQLFAEDEIHYQDHWNGIVRPLLDKHRNEFNDPNTSSAFADRYILPQSLRGMAIYIQVLQAFEPDDYINNHRGDLRKFTDHLEKVHDISRDGIFYMAVPFDFPPSGNQIPWGGGEMGFRFSPPGIST